MTLIALMLALLPMTGFAAETFVDPQDRGFPADYPGIPSGRYVEDAQEGAQANFGVQPVHDNTLFATFQADRFEVQWPEGKDLFLWDVQGWIGRDYHKLYIESEGEVVPSEDRVEEAVVELLYSRAIGSFLDLQAGIRHDFEPDPERSFAALGIQGLAPYWFEIDATAYLSEDGDLSAALEAEYELLFTQRLILVPRLETSFALQEVEEYGVGQGINDLTLGVRLRYEIRRELAPYVGFTWTRKVGETENLAEEEGEDVETFAVVAGVRFWF